MPISAEAGVMPALVNASLTFSIASGGVTTYQPEPSSFKSSAPASSTMSNILSSLACSLGTTISPLRWNIQPTAPASARFPPFLLIKCRNSPTTRLRSEEHTSELQSRSELVCRLLLEKKKKKKINHFQVKNNKKLNKTK